MIEDGRSDEIVLDTEWKVFGFKVRVMFFGCSGWTDLGALKKLRLFLVPIFLNISRIWNAVIVIGVALANDVSKECRTSSWTKKCLTPPRNSLKTATVWLPESGSSELGDSLYPPAKPRTINLVYFTLYSTHSFNTKTSNRSFVILLRQQVITCAIKLFVHRRQPRVIAQISLSS